MKKVETFEIAEVLLVGYRPRTNQGANIGLSIGRDDLNVDKSEYLRTHLGQRFALVMVPIGDDEKPVIIDDPVAKKITKRYTQMGNIRRNDPPYQQVLREWFENKEGYEWIKNHNRLDPAERRKVTAAIQHQFCNVKSLADIQPNSRESLQFDLLESLYEADKAGLPPPNMEPNVYKLIAHGHD